MSETRLYDVDKNRLHLNAEERVASPATTCDRPAAAIRGAVRWLRLGVLASGLSLAGGQVDAGAWPRDASTSFLSFSVQDQFHGDGDGAYASVFYEYGLSETLTFGVDVGGTVGTGRRRAIVFLRHPVLRNEGPDLFAAELGLGLTEDGDPALRPGFSWGRPWQRHSRSGWMGIESSYAFHGDGTGLAKIDTTLGINHAGDKLSVFQLQVSSPSEGEATAAIAASYVIPVTDTVRLEIGGSHEIRNAVNQVKFGVWTVF